ncbi:putative holin, partial [Acidovorax sp. SUPP2522]|uniref:putative holin n=1 Tax=Acidovorax sp. SUPP2522 TaxID=511900 RepID=UPI0024E0FF63
MQLRDSIPVWLRAPRNSLWLVLAIVLIALIAAIAPQKLSLTIYKSSLVALAAVMGYWLDRALFPYARPDSYLHKDWRLVSAVSAPLLTRDRRKNYSRSLSPSRRTSMARQLLPSAAVAT